MDKNIANAAIQLLNRVEVKGVTEANVLLQVVATLQAIVNAPDQPAPAPQPAPAEAAQ